ncbi:HypC/HybG/HupF family hydrogenase formation chaperone [Marinobacterium lutimaris]|uniref:Hydrogenase expression/formation protein HypC n=1 Tax=Marinobacterium lutimaris TaxID=568106 RepID=A0A1H5YVL3_9GAMM|nr:HypC/HybG/HupF family hydrogenase formation chaperone [Marinobacterium lutimaris]SEG28151.1 hydrogenase expression/formation protein HypC [Marinobacterium lutimaris]
MCIGVPMQVLEIESGRALCSGRGEQTWVDTRLVGPFNQGDWLMVFAGAARDVMTAERATQVSSALEALHASARGDVAAIDRLFADLVDREPQLPEHLRGAVHKPIEN